MFVELLYLTLLLELLSLITTYAVVLRLIIVTCFAFLRCCYNCATAVSSNRSDPSRRVPPFFRIKMGYPPPYWDAIAADLVMLLDYYVVS
jgi:hypothetical protein